MTTASVVFVVPENTEDGRFASYLAALVEGGRLRRVVFDECHHLVLDQKWRKGWAAAVKAIGSRYAPVQRVFLSATLPGAVLDDLRREMGLQPGFHHIRQRVVGGNVAHRVRLLPDRGDPIRELQTALEQYASTPNPRVLIYVMAYTVGKLVANRLGIPFHSAEQGGSDKDTMLSDFRKGFFD